MTPTTPHHGHHPITYLSKGLDCCSKEELIECIEGLDRNLTAARAERNKYEQWWLALCNSPNDCGCAQT